MDRHDGDTTGGTTGGAGRRTGSTAPRWRRASVFAALVLLLTSILSASSAQASSEGPADSYRITVGSGATVLPGDVDLGLHCDDCGTWLYPPFPVTAYGTQYSQMWVSSNGVVQLGGGTSTTYSNACLPHAGLTGPTFLPFWDDLDTRSVGEGVYHRTYGSAPYRQLTVEWRSHRLGDEGRSSNFSLVFSEASGEVTATYGSTTDDGAGATVGAQNGSTANQYACNGSGAVFPGLRITYNPTTATHTAPGAPQALQATGDAASPSRATISWSAPASDGGSPIIGYVAARNGSDLNGHGPFTSRMQSASSRSFTFASLLPGTTYQFTVRAVNGVGQGPATTVSFRTPAGVPGAPLIGAASAGTTGLPITAKARWTPPSYDGGTALTGYRVHAFRVVSGADVESLTSTLLAPSTRSHVFRLTRKGSWRFTVSAYNALGGGRQSAYSNVVAGR